MLKKIITNRRVIQGLTGAAVFMAVSYYPSGLIYVLTGGSLTGIIFGKVFCRWMCPMGFIMELMMRGGKDEKASHLYNYHKMGCPIAWAGGLLNKISFLKIRRSEENCTSCGLCDRTCYISTLNKDYSLYKKNKSNPAVNFSCSKCLECVAVCPAGSLTYTSRQIKK